MNIRLNKRVCRNLFIRNNKWIWSLNRKSFESITKSNLWCYWTRRARWRISYIWLNEICVQIFRIFIWSRFTWVSIVLCFQTFFKLLRNEIWSHEETYQITLRWISCNRVLWWRFWGSIKTKWKRVNVSLKRVRNFRKT